MAEHLPWALPLRLGRPRYYFSEGWPKVLYLSAPLKALRRRSWALSSSESGPESCKGVGRLYPACKSASEARGNPIENKLVCAGRLGTWSRRYATWTSSDYLTA